MIEAFIASWSLFGDTYLTGWLIAALLGLIGVVATARDQIFIGAATAQASTAGIALGIAAPRFFGETGAEWAESDGFLAAMAVAGSLVAAFLTERGERRGESREALLGWIFLASSAASVLLVAHSPHGIEEIHRVAASTIIGADRGDVRLFLGFFAAAAGVIAWKRRSILLYALDPETAGAIGIPVGFWRFAVAASFGLAVGLSIRASGLLFTFGCLVLPALTAKNLCRTISGMFVLAPIIAVLVSAAAFVVANQRDDPPAQAAVLFLALAKAGAHVFRRIVPRS